MGYVGRYKYGPKMAAIKRAFGGKRKTSSKRRKIAAPRRTAFRARMGAPAMHSFSRWRALTYTSAITLPAGSSSVSKAYQYKLEDLPNYTEFTSLFDQYKIWKIVLQFKLHSNPEHAEAVSAASGGGLQYIPITYPTMYIVNDHDDTNTETLDQLRERQKTKRFILFPNKITKWTVRPSILAATYRTALTTGYAPKFNTWLDAANTDIPHYGTKLCIDYDGFSLPPVSGVSWGDIVVNVEMKYYFSCKDVR